MWKSTRNPRIEELTKSFKGRSLQLSYDMKPTIGSSGKEMCCWCGEVELTGRQKKYCSPECSEAIYAWANPQKENGLHALLVRQDWRCITCGFDYRPILERVLIYFKLKNWFIPHFGGHPSRRFMKIFKNNCPGDRTPEVDHVVPIAKGGVSLGFSNTQILCSLCHLDKTKRDNSGPRKKNGVV